MPPKSSAKSGGVGGGGTPSSRNSTGIIRKHPSSSDGESPNKPPLKKPANPNGAVEKKSQTQGATSTDPASAPTDNDPVLQAIKSLEAKVDTSIADQAKFRESMETRLKNMEKRLDEKIGAESKSVRDDIAIDIQVLTDRVNAYDASLKRYQASTGRDIEDIRARLAELEKGQGDESHVPFSPDTTIVATGMRYSQDENIKEKAEQFVKDGLGLDDMVVVDAMRTPFRNNRPGIVKIQFESKTEKERALNQRFELKNSRNYSKVFIRTSMSHIERLIHLNTKTLLEASGAADNYAVLQSGRAVKKELLAQWKQNRQGGAGGGQRQAMAAAAGADAGGRGGHNR